MDIPANQCYVPCLFTWIQAGMPTLTRAHRLA
jgi:hypothetical protein